MVPADMTHPPESTVIRCPRCERLNRVRPDAKAVPRCANCHRALPWLVTADENSFDAETTAAVPVLVDFWAPWCGPCRLVSPVLDRLATRHAGEMKLVKVNVDENPEVAARYGAMSIPLLVLIEHGQEVDRQVGAAPEPRLASWLEPRLMKQT